MPSKMQTAEPQNKEPQNIEVKKIGLFFFKLLLFDIPCSIFDILLFVSAKWNAGSFSPGLFADQL
jgi:hypothetical protein